MSFLDTPICDFVKSYIGSDFSRLHMPGHKGRAFLGFEKFDITEISGADYLYRSTGIIARSEENLAKLFGTKHSFYSTEGSTLCIKAMLFTAMQNAQLSSLRPVVLASRNVHKAFIYACALLDIDVRWLYPEDGALLSACTGILSPDALDRKLSEMDCPPFAVYITSPDYLGGISDIPGLSRVCGKHGVPLLVDNAHGAYLKFLQKSLHPCDLGASMCCDSAHKTLPVLTGGAYLHISGSAPEAYSQTAKSAMALFGSTSPSYLILQSLDLCNKYLSEGYQAKLEDCIRRLDKLKTALAQKGCAVKDTEPLKLVIEADLMGASGFDIGEALRINKVECEFCDCDHAVLMFTPENPEADYKRIFKALSGPNECRQNDSRTAPHKTAPADRAMSIRKAIFSKHESVSPEASAGRICSAPVVSCPPEVPLAVSGEIISEEAVLLMKKYGIKSVEVVCE